MIFLNSKSHLINLNMDMRVCLDCHKPMNGRSDKKFCGDHCRNSYHNRHSNGYSRPVKTVNGILKTNRKIIHHLLDKNNEKIVSESTLKELGFKFEYCTKVITKDDSQKEYHCYEYIYFKTKGNKYSLTRMNFNASY